MRIKLPDDVKYIIDKLTENGYEAYAVGGCVRDSIIHREPGDWDITTSATPSQVKAVFRRTIDTGIQHGTVTIMLGKNGYEVTTYRVDGVYLDGRHPENVEFTSSLEEDLKRRDFTINAMAYNDIDGIVDEFDGQEDLKKGIIKCVGNPVERFTEDALRMLRAVRFSAQLGFEIDELTAQAIRQMAPTIAKVSKERIHTELGKTLLSPHPDYIMKAFDYGITAIVFKSFDKIRDKDVAMKLVKAVPDNLGYKYAALLYEAGQSEAGRMLKELKLDNNTIAMCENLVALHGREPVTNPAKLRHHACKTGPELLMESLVFEEIFYEITGNRELKDLVIKEKQMLEDYMGSGICLTLKQLAIKGKDLMEIGIQPGRRMGEILEYCLDMVLDEPSLNECNTLIDLAKKKI